MAEIGNYPYLSKCISRNFDEITKIRDKVDFIRMEKLFYILLLKMDFMF